MARALNGTGDRIDVGPLSFSNGLTRFSLGGMVNWQSWTWYVGVCYKPGSYSINLAGNYDFGPDDAYVQILDGTCQALCTTHSPLVYDRWFHFLLVFDGWKTPAGHRLKFYLDGMPMALSPIGGGFAPLAVLPSNSNNFVWGRGKDYDGNCRVAEWGAWDTALTDGECFDLGFRRWKPIKVARRNLRAYWPFDNSMYDLIDVVGGNNATLTGTTSYPNPPMGIPPVRKLIYSPYVINTLPRPIVVAR